MPQDISKPTLNSVRRNQEINSTRIVKKIESIDWLRNKWQSQTEAVFCSELWG